MCCLTPRLPPKRDTSLTVAVPMLLLAPAPLPKQKGDFRNNDGEQGDEEPVPAPSHSGSPRGGGEQASDAGFSTLVLGLYRPETHDGLATPGTSDSY